MKSKDLREKRAKLINDARNLADGAKGRVMSAEDNAKFDAMMAEADALKHQIDRIELADLAIAENMEEMRNSARGAGMRAGEVNNDRALERSAFGAWMRGGVTSLDDEQRGVYARCFNAPKEAGAPGGWRLSPRNALGVTTDPAGGYTVPVGFYTRLIDAQLAYGGMITPGVCNLIETATGAALPIPTDNDTTNEGVIIQENTQAGMQDVPFGSVVLNSYTFTSKIVLVSRQLLEDSAFDIDAFLSGKLGVRIARAVNRNLTVGTGASAPTGAVNAATLGYTAGGSTSSGSVATVNSDDLLELEHSVDPAYRLGARFMMNDAMLKVIKKLKDGIGRPLWLPGLAVKEPDTINSYPYVINQHMATPAASVKSMLFGDFQNYFMRRVAEVTLLRLVERYADFNQVGFVAFQRWDGNLVDAGTHPVKYLQQSAT